MEEFEEIIRVYKYQKKELQGQRRRFQIENNKLDQTLQKKRQDLKEFKVEISGLDKELNNQQFEITNLQNELTKTSTEISFLEEKNMKEQKKILLERNIWDDYLKELQKTVPEEVRQSENEVEKAKTEAEYNSRSTLREIEKVKSEIYNQSQQVEMWKIKLEKLKMKIKEVMEDDEILIIEEKIKQDDEQL